MIKFLPLGGADEVGASCYYLYIDGTGIILDCGIHPQKIGLESLPDFDLIKDEPIDFVFISHAHQDHIGALPFLIKKFPHLQIFSTIQTAEIALLTLHNSANLLREEINDETFPIYTHEEVDMLIRSIKFYNYKQQIEISGLCHSNSEKIKVTFHDAGHILGAAAILIEYANKIIFYTGDFRLEEQFIMNGVNFPKTKVDFLITETTYGSTPTEKLETFHSESKRFAKEANKIISLGGSILVPVFALGKMQEILMMIHLLMVKNQLTHVPIYTGGLAKDISHLYDLNKYLVKRNYPDVDLKKIEQKDYYLIKDVNQFFKESCIVLATSGMVLPRTVSHRLTEYWLDNSKSAIFIVSYCSPETPGYALINAKEGQKIIFNSFEKEVKCDIKKFNFPSHASRNSIVELIKKVSPEKLVLIHGEENSHKWIGENALSLNSHMNVYSPSKGKEIVFD